MSLKDSHYCTVLRAILWTDERYISSDYYYYLFENKLCNNTHPSEEGNVKE